MRNSTHYNLRNVVAILKILFLKISTKQYVEKKTGDFCIITNLYKSHAHSVLSSD